MNIYDVQGSHKKFTEIGVKASLCLRRRGNRNQCEMRRRMFGVMPVCVCCAMKILNPPSW